MIIYHLWDGGDQVLSQEFYATFADAVTAVRKDYSIKGPIKLDAEGRWEGKAPPEGANHGGLDVHISREDITATREGLCWALKNIPNF